MKNLTFILLLFVLINVSASAQQTRKTDDALLLEYYQGQRFADALTYLKTVYIEPVTDAQELSRLAYTSYMASKLPEAEGFYQQLYGKDSTNRSVLYNIASINQRRGNSAKAEIFYKKLVAIDTANFAAYNRLAQINRDKSDTKNEIYYLQKANRLNPTDADVASDLSYAYILQGQPLKAEKVLSVAIAADPANIILLQSLLKLNYTESKWQQTVKTAEQLVLLGDSTGSTLSKLGHAYYQTKNYNCGLATLLAIPDANRTEGDTYFIAVCYKQLKDQKKAIFYFNKAIFLSISTSTAVYYNEVADCYETLKQFKKAQASYQKGLLYDDKPITYYFLATMYDTELKDKKNALKYFRKFVAGKTADNEKKYVDYSMARIAALSAK